MFHHVIFPHFISFCSYALPLLHNQHYLFCILLVLFIIIQFEFEFEFEWYLLSLKKLLLKISISHTSHSNNNYNYNYKYKYNNMIYLMILFWFIISSSSIYCIKQLATSSQCSNLVFVNYQQNTNILYAACQSNY